MNVRNCKEGNKIWKCFINIMNPDYYVVILSSKPSEINQTTSKDFNFMHDLHIYNHWCLICYSCIF